MLDILLPAGQPFTGPSVQPFVRFDVAVGERDHPQATMQTGRVMHEGLQAHVHSEGGRADTCGVDIRKHKAIGGQIVRQVRGLPINTVGRIKLDRGHKVGWRGCHVAIHGVTAEFIHLSPADGPKRAIRRALVRLDRSENRGKKRVIGAHQVLQIG